MHDVWLIACIIVFVLVKSPKPKPRSEPNVARMLSERNQRAAAEWANVLTQKCALQKQSSSSPQQNRPELRLLSLQMIELIGDGCCCISKKSLPKVCSDDASGRQTSRAESSRAQCMQIKLNVYCSTAALQSRAERTRGSKSVPDCYISLVMFSPGFTSLASIALIASRLQPSSQQLPDSSERECLCAILVPQQHGSSSPAILHEFFSKSQDALHCRGV